MKKIAIYLFLLGLIFSCSTENKTEISKTEINSPSKIKVYLLGSFHFAQMDSTYNVLDEDHQKSIKQLCQTIANQKPDKVFIESQPEFEFQNKYGKRFSAYKADENFISKRKNEIYQVGFRVAKMLGHKKVYQCDNPGRYGMYYEKVLKYAKENNQMGYLNKTEKYTVVNEFDRVDGDSLRNVYTLYNYIKWFNSDIVMDTSHAGYITNYPQVGNKDYYNYDNISTLIGSQLVADWYRRNIMIYTKMINQLTYNEDAIFLIIGADHVPTLKHLFNSNPYFEVVETKAWLTN